MNETIESIQSGKESIIRVLFRYCLPCIVGLIFTSCIIVVDGIFIGIKIGENGLAALSLTLPPVYLLCAITTTLGIGGITLSARSLGAQEYHRANSYFSLSLAAIVVITIMIIGTIAIFFEEVIFLLGANQITQPYISDFLGTILYFYLFFMLNIAFSMFIRSEGKPILALAFTLAGNIINLVLDYLFIMHFEWGMKGAALASGIAVLIPFLFALCYFLSSKSTYKFCKFNLNKTDSISILINGAPEFIAQAALAITTFAFNRILLDTIGVHGVAAFTIIGYVTFIYTMIITGIGIGIHPLWSYSFGAKKNTVIIELLNTALKFALFIGILIYTVAFIAAENIITLFADGNTTLITTATLGLQYSSTAFILGGYNFIATVFFTAIGKATTSAIISFLRSLALVLLAIATLPKIIGANGIWFAVPLAELVSFIGIYFMIKNKIRQI